MSVKRCLRRTEDHAAIEDWCDLLRAVLHVSIPHFKMPTPLVIPVFVQKQKKVESPIEIPTSMGIEVRMDFEESACLDFMKSAAFVMHVWNNVRNASQRL